MDKEETYYEILRVARTASISEIVAAYHSARAAFSKDSMAMYSLFTKDEADKVLSKLEEAYLTLSNITKKQEYDRLIASNNPSHGVLLAPSLETQLKLRTTPATSSWAPTPLDKFTSPPEPKSGPPPASPPVSENSTSPIASPLNTNRGTEPGTTHGADPISDQITDPLLPLPNMVSGGLLKSIRERRCLSVDDVSRITKIPQRFIVAIETEDLAKLPAKVYMQGFVKNLAVLYKLAPEATARQFVDLIDKKKTGS